MERLYLLSVGIDIPNPGVFLWSTIPLQRAKGKFFDQSQVNGRGRQKIREDRKATFGSYDELYFSVYCTIY